jgi:hypothetical protein
MTFFFKKFILLSTLFSSSRDKRCAACRRLFPSPADAIVVEEKKYCRVCSQRLSNPTANGKCAHCHLGLENTFLKALNRKYHPDCLVSYTFFQTTTTRER